jgi:hypothetical protein
MKLFIVSLLFAVAATAALAYSAGVRAEHERGNQAANDAMHFGMSIGYICGDFHDYDCLSSFKAPQ